MLEHFKLVVGEDNTEYIAIPKKEYKLFEQSQEDIEDIVSIKLSKYKIKNGDDEVIPWEMSKRLCTDESPVKIWREYRGLTPKELNKQTGISLSVISKLENNKQELDIVKLKALSKALCIEYDDLLD